MRFPSVHRLGFVGVILLALTGCSTAWQPTALPLNSPARTAACEANGMTWMTTRPLSWQQLQIHPNLQARPERVNTLVAADGRVVGYCQSGCGCRTNDWRRVADGRSDCPADARPWGMCVPVDAGEARTPREVNAPAPPQAPARTVAN
ncbi:MAG: hypothetical protein MUC89_18070 [Acetobacteraceae bacterium]|jgi:hypothetical protein|nr:hypothetical protein [Acetobacteraceae bacterium]